MPLIVVTEEIRIMTTQIAELKAALDPALMADLIYFKKIWDLNGWGEVLGKMVSICKRAEKPATGKNPPADSVDVPP